MGSLTLADATDLELWANRRDAQENLPRLCRRLVHATCKGIAKSGFRAGEGIQLPGWDGVVVVEEGNAFVPTGSSAWELGVNKDIKQKADADYAKRSQDLQGLDPSQSAFVFVTPRRWSGKAEWEREHREAGLWRDVRVYDADNIEEWLELAPAVHVWLSILLGKRPEDAEDLETFLADWSAVTSPRISTELLLAGRSQAVKEIHDWIGGASPALAIQSESMDEAIAVFASAIQFLTPEGQANIHSRALVVRSMASLARLSACESPLVLIARFDVNEGVARSIRSGHRTVIPVGRSVVASENALVIPRVSKEEAQKAIEASGVEQERARELAALARRSVTLFRRKTAIAPEAQQPAWGRPEHGRSLLPALLAGSWSDSMQGDREAVAAIAGASYDELREGLVRWASEDDAPVQKIGDVWLVISKEDAWSQLGRYLQRDDLERFKAEVIRVLGTPDPRFDLPEEERWSAGLYGHTPRWSPYLEKGLSDTLALMGARGEAVGISGEATASSYANHIVGELLRIANKDWRVWASLSASECLPLLAEAAPDAFLAAAEEGLKGNPPVLLQLFIDSKEYMFSSSPHTGLLWALETLAWSPKHLGRAAQILATLARLDPGGRLVNRPHRSLRSIFLPWHPQTAASLEARLNVIDVLRKREPRIAWGLMKQLLPEFHSIGEYTAKPQWQEWVPEAPAKITQAEYFKAVAEVANRLIQDVGKDGSRWESLIDALPTLPSAQFDAVAGQLEGMDFPSLEAKAQKSIWNALRELVSRHRAFADAAWAMPEARVSRLEAILKRFQPANPVTRYAWLFSFNPQLPEKKEKSWEEIQATKLSLQIEGARAVMQDTGLDGLVELTEEAESPWEVGRALGSIEMAEALEDRILCENLGNPNKKRALFARGFVIGRETGSGRTWAERKLAGLGRSLSSKQKAELLMCMPWDAATWDLLETLDAETHQNYWKNVNPLWLDRQEDMLRVIRKLLEHERAFSAADYIAMCIDRIKVFAPEAVLEVLEKVIETPPESDQVGQNFAYNISHLLDWLERAEGIPVERLARLEMAFMPIFPYHERNPRILHGELARNPGFFVELLKVVFKAEGEEARELSQEEKTRGTLCYELLNSWRTLPGTADDGSIRAEELKDWVEKARTAASEVGRGPICEHVIGQLLAYSPAGTDGVWPHEAVRDVIEEVSSVELDHGLQNGVYNSRGVVSKSMTEGGAQESALADKYASFADSVADRWPRTAAVLRAISETYRAEARREDQQTELRENCYS